MNVLNDTVRRLVYFHKGIYTVRPLLKIVLVILLKNTHWLLFNSSSRNRFVIQIEFLIK